MRNYIPRWWISRPTDDEVVAHERRRPALRQIYRDHTGGTEQDVEAWMDGRRTEDRFVEDLWGGSG
ncbi:MAG: hypothetical protein WA892_01625 [Ornithinimicrobium sp.]